MPLHLLRPGQGDVPPRHELPREAGGKLPVLPVSSSSSEHWVKVCCGRRGARLLVLAMRGKAPPPLDPTTNPSTHPILHACPPPSSTGACGCCCRCTPNSAQCPTARCRAAPSCAPSGGGRPHGRRTSGVQPTAPCCGSRAAPEGAAPPTATPPGRAQAPTAVLVHG